MSLHQFWLALSEQKLAGQTRFEAVYLDVQQWSFGVYVALIVAPAYFRLLTPLQITEKQVKFIP